MSFAKLQKFVFICLSLLVLSCNDTRLGDVDLDFDVSIDTKEVVSYLGKPVRIGLDVQKVDSHNNYPIEMKIKAPKGKLKSGDTLINSDEALYYDFDKEGTYYFEYTPIGKGEETVTITFKNERVTKTVSCMVDCHEALYDIELKDAPERPLIDTRFDFDLYVKEMEKTGADSIVGYAKVLKGEGTVYSGEQVINLPLTGDEINEELGNISTLHKTSFAIGSNNISYISKVEGENIIRFYTTNKWGIQTFQDISTNIFLPEWNLSNSEGKNEIEVPYKDNFSFTLNITEKDIFKENSYTGSFRILSNTDLSLKINNKDYSQGSSIPMTAGGNISVMNVLQSGVGAIEFIVKDKYKQEYRDTLNFTTKLPVKPIEAQLDKSSQSVKVNQKADFNLTLSEVNYNGLFQIELQSVSGTGTFEGGNTPKEHIL